MQLGMIGLRPDGREHGAPSSAQSPRMRRVRPQPQRGDGARSGRRPGGRVARRAAAKRAGLREYGTLAQRNAREFDHKWLRGGAPADELLIGSADIQSLADLGNSFEVVKGMRSVPFTGQTVLQLAVTTLVPVGPLMLTMISLEQLLERLLRIVF